MFRKIIEFFKSIFKKEKVKLLESNIEKTKGTTEDFKKTVQFDNGKNGKELIKEILDEKNANINMTVEELEEITGKLIDYIDVLLRRIDNCQKDISIKKNEIIKLSNLN